MRKKGFVCFCLFLFLSTFLIGGTANAALFNLAGVNDNYNTATVEFDYNFNERRDLTDYGEVKISITNTGQYDPVITGFGFNVPNEVYYINGFSGPSGWFGVFHRNSISTPEQYGFFDVAGMTGASGLEGGNPQKGIPVDETFDFNFKFKGPDFEGLNTDSFLSELSDIKHQGTPVPFLARVQQTGLDGEGSDVMIHGEGDPASAPVPEPATMMLFGTGLLALAGFGRKKFFTGK
ncbi:MAG: PEP-CTERM sorting domain-containing protein [Candidatus Paceibacterota bacterium]